MQRELPEASRLGERSWRCPAAWLVAGYSLVFVVVARVLDVSFAQLTPIPLNRELAPRAQRYFVTHEDTVNASLSVEVLHEGIHLRASGLRGQGLVLGARAPALLVEQPCLPGVPHVHGKALEEEQLSVEFQAKSPLVDAAIVVASSEGVRRGPRRLLTRSLRYRPQVPLSREWQTYVVALDLDQRRDSARHGATQIDLIQLEFEPRTEVDLMIRDLRAVRAADPVLGGDKYP